MNSDQVLDVFRDAGALLEGHFILSSGLHSGVFLQKMFVFQDPVRTERLCKALATKIEARFGKIDYVVSPEERASAIASSFAATLELVREGVLVCRVGPGEQAELHVSRDRAHTAQFDPGINIRKFGHPPASPAHRP